MYNKEQKMKFIRSYTRSIAEAGQIEKFFDLCEPAERKFKADMCSMTKEELSTLSDILSSKRSSVKYLLWFMSYLKWCANARVAIVSKDAINFTTDDSKTVYTRSRMVANPTHLQLCLDAVFDPEELESKDMVFRAAMWLVYAGIPPEEIMEVTTDNIDIERMQINYKGNTYPIYHQAARSLIAVAKLTAFKMYHPNYKDVYTWDRLPGNKLLRIFRNTTQHSFRREMIKKFTEAIEDGRASVNLSLTNVFISGDLYRRYELECATGEEPYIKLYSRRMAYFEWKTAFSR